MDVSIERVRARRVVAVRHRGAYRTIGEAFAKLRAYAASRGLGRDLTGAIGIFYDDPCAVPEGELRSAACMEVPDDFEVGEGEPVEVLTIPGGEYAVVVHRGSYAGLVDVYGWIYREWLPTSGRRAARGASFDFEVYLNDPEVTGEAELKTAVHVPVE